MYCKLKLYALLASLFIGASLVAHAATAAPVEPEAPKPATYADGRIELNMGSDQMAGYGIGDPMKVVLVFDITPESLFRAREKGDPRLLPSHIDGAGKQTPPVAPPLPAANAPGSTPLETAKSMEWPVIDVESLKMAATTGKVTEQASDVEVYRGATVESYSLPDGRRRVVVTLVLTQYVTTQKEADGKTVKTHADVAMDFSWAVASGPDGQPLWHTETTPVLTFGIHQTADPNQTRLVEGDLEAKESPRPKATWWLLLGSSIFALPALGALFLSLSGSARRKREATVNEKTWAAISLVVERAMLAQGFGLEHYQQIFHILREHFQFYGITTTQALERIAASAEIDHEAGAYVFNQETLLYDSEKMRGAADRAELFRQIAVLVPISDEVFERVAGQADKIIERTNS